MARNSEKAQSMLFRFRASQATALGIVDTSKTRRPKNPNTIDQLPLLEKWRATILREISRKVTKIQEKSLSDYQLRDLNDEINNLMHEKYRWERRIRDVGGPNYSRGGGTMLDESGGVIAGGGRGYKYFGRARELPGVKEMFEAAAAKAREEREGAKGGGMSVEQDLRRKGADAKYFGWGTDETDNNGRLLKEEADREEELRREMLEMGDGWLDPDGEEDGAERRREREGQEVWEPLPGDVGDGVRWRLPTAMEVQEELVERRRRRLLDKLGEDD